MRTIAIVNQKGGCGKTTSAINLSGIFSQRGEPTLLIDLDPQSHCAAGLAIPESEIDMQIGDALLADPNRKIDLTRLIWRVRRDLHVIPSTVKLAGIEAAQGMLADAEDRDQRLHAFLDRHARTFSWCILDCPPSIGLLTYNALRAADVVIIPVETSFFALHGAERQIATLRSIDRRMGRQTPHYLLPTMHDPDSRLASDVLKALRQRHAEKLLPCVVRIDQHIREATSLGQPVVEYDANSPGAHDYLAVAQELTERAMAPAPPGAERPQSEAPEEPAAPLTSALPTSNRATEIAERARRLLERTHRLQEQSPSANRAPGERPMQVHLANEPTPVPPPAAVQNTMQRMYGVRETSRGILFVHPGPPTMRVCVAGDFNGWDPGRTRLAYNEAVGVHEACVNMPPGMHEYRLVIDGRWITDPFNPSSVTNPFGERNSVVVVTRAALQPMMLESAD